MAVANVPRDGEVYIVSVRGEANIKLKQKARRLIREVYTFQMTKSKSVLTDFA